MLTVAPGPDIALYHDRRVAVLGPKDWPSWLNQSIPAREVLKPSSTGSLNVEEVI